MKKIILLLNASNLGVGLIKSAVSMASKNNSMVEAIFLNDFNMLNTGYPFPNDFFLTQQTLALVNATDENMKLLHNLAQQFIDECKKEHVEYKVEIDKSVSITHLITLSRFADFIVADAKADSGEYSLKDILADAHCPVFLVSPNAATFQKVFLAYDGSASSMYAIKMFSYLFPEYKDLPTSFFQIVSGTDKEILHKDEIVLWASKHFSNISFTVIQGSIKKDIVNHIQIESEKSIVVMGSYSGSAVTRIFINSASDAVINDTNASLFITHE